MDLSTEDVAELLNVPLETIERWLNTDSIPAHIVGKQYKFSRLEIEDWVMRAENKNIPGIELNSEIKLDFAQKFSLFRSAFHGNVYRNISGNKENVISEVTQKIAEQFDLDSSVLKDLLLDREELIPTGLNNGIAVPHARDFLMPKPLDVVSVAFPQTPIDWGSLDNKPVYAIFFIFACKDKHHLHLLAKIAHFCQNQDNIDFLQTKPSKTDLLNHMRSWESKVRPLTVSCT